MGLQLGNAKSFISLTLKISGEQKLMAVVRYVWYRPLNLDVRPLLPAGKGAHL